MRLGSSVLLAAALALVAAPGSATKPARACIDAHAAGQVERDASRLLEARARFKTCAAEACPAMIRKECAQLDAALSPLVPSIVLVAQDAHGATLAGARASVDDRFGLPALDSTPIELNPGVHHVEVVLPDGRRQAVDFALNEGEKSRRVVATFALAKPAKATSSPSSGNELAYVLGGVGLLAFGTWGAFAWDGSRRQAQLETCAPRCTNLAEVHAMRRSYLIADVLLGVSVATVGTSAYLLINNATADKGSVGRSMLVGVRGRF
jgi:hypothetical protein